MRVVVDFQDESLDFEVAEDRLVAAWNGPPAIEGSRLGEVVRAALEEPVDYPPARQMVVPGDRVAIAVDPAISDPATVLAAVVDNLAEAGVERGDVTVVVPSGAADWSQALPRGAALVTHDPKDRSQLVYLAATNEGRRIYLNRAVTDADVVIPIGRLGFDPIMGYRGPWSVIFPGLSDHETMQAHRGRLKGAALDGPASGARAALDESFEVSWLLGSAFHIGLVPAAFGFAEVIAGRETAVRDRAIASVERLWKLQVDSRAEVVVVGVGGRGSQTTLDDLAGGLALATGLVQHGGKIVVLSRVLGGIGPSLHRLIDVEDPKNGVAALRGHEGDDDYLVARRLSHALAWADVFLHSRLDRDLAEGLSVCALERPEQARRLVERSTSCLFVSQAELTHATVRSENEGR
jgi:hypothetical protein